MLKKIIRFSFVLALVGAFFILVGYMSVKAYYVSEATEKAEKIIKDVFPDQLSQDAEIIALATYVFENFKWREPSEIPVLRLRPYITNHRLPDFLRYPDGVIETLIQEGFCDNASRMLSFILARKGYDSVQLNIVTETSAHSVLRVSLPDGRKVMVDPYYGYIAYDKNTKKMLSPEDARNRMSNGQHMDSVFLALTSKSHPDFYKNFGSSFMSAQGDILTITTDIPFVKTGDALALGSIDGDDEDVKNMAIENKMTPFWHYAGHKYNREWVRILKAKQNVRFEMILVKDAEDGILTASPAPHVEGKKLVWEIKAGDQITFRDALAKISLKRLNSYIGVDQIIITPMP